MTSFSNLQHEAFTTLTAAAADSGNALFHVPVVEFVGSSANRVAIESALQDKGCVVFITVPKAGKLISQASGTSGTALAILDASFGVEIQVDVERNDTAKNTSGLNKSIYDLVRAVLASLSAVKTVNPNDCYRLAQDAIMGDTFDAGLWVYLVTFLKRCAL